MGIISNHKACKNIKDELFLDIACDSANKGLSVAKGPVLLLVGHSTLNYWTLEVPYSTPERENETLYIVETMNGKCVILYTRWMFSKL